MRVISGRYKGTNIKGYDIEGTRPTMDRVKESLFAMIQDYLKDSTCLDLFAGSGNLGIEALSNGAKSCYFIDKQKKAIEVIRDNLNKINIKETTHLLENDYGKAIKQFGEKGLKFDIIFVDPPYDLKITNKIIRLIDENNILNTNGLIVLEYEFDTIKEPRFTEFKKREYGSKTILILKNDK